MVFDLEFQKDSKADWKRHRSYTDYPTADKNYERYKDLNPGYGWRIVTHTVDIHAAYTPTKKARNVQR